MRKLIIILIFFLFAANILNGDEEYSFDLSSVKKKSFEYNGYFEFRPVLSVLNKDSRVYFLNFYNIDEGSTLNEYNFNLLFNLSYEKGIFRAVTTSNILIANKFEGWENKISFYESYISIKPSNSLSLNIGKKRMKWGKGYAWNPAAFVDRPKNPNDPELALEGFVVFSFEYTKSFKGALKTLSISPLILPVNENINSELGNLSMFVFGGKIYLLLINTDIDLMFLSGANFNDRFGVDFSRNISSNIEVHGEFSFIPGLDQSERVSFLLGTRFLTRTDITFIFEYYKNARGLSTSDFAEYYLEIDDAYKLYLETGESDLIEQIKESTEPAFRSFASMREYLYLRISKKEPFDILYLTPSITAIYNLGDTSFSFAPELIYSPLTNLEFRAKISLFFGKSGSDFGEKQNKFRLEFRGRYYF